jgi:hypothetical protein
VDDHKPLEEVNTRLITSLFLVVIVGELLVIRAVLVPD